MWVKSPGARTWWVRSTTAIKPLAGFLLAGFLLCHASGVSTATEAGVSRIIDSVARYHPAIEVARRQIEADCVDNTLCAAEIIAARLGAPAHIEAVTHPTSDEIRRVHGEPSVTGVALIPPHTLRITLDRFGRKADWELVAAIERAQPIDMIELDLRGNGGGDLDRMRRIAGIFIGYREAAFSLVAHDARTSIDIPAHPSGIVALPVRILVGPGTASSAEILTALLRAYAYAEIRGKQTFGKDYLLRMVPVDHDTRLLIPAERIEIPGQDLTAGVIPDGPIDPLNP